MPKSSVVFKQAVLIISELIDLFNKSASFVVKYSDLFAEQTDTSKANSDVSKSYIFKL